jgi:hypothetical protein
MTILSNAVKIAAGITKNLKMQEKVTIRRFTGDGGVGDPVESTVKVDAIVERRMRRVRNANGEMVGSSTNVTILDPTIKVTTNDRVTLADGTSGPILSVTGPRDASGNLLTQVYLG